MFVLEWKRYRAAVGPVLAKGVKLALAGRAGAALMGGAVGGVWPAECVKDSALNVERVCRRDADRIAL